MALVRNHTDSAFSHWRMKLGVMPEFSGAEWAYQEVPTKDAPGGTDTTPDGTTAVWYVVNMPIQHTESVFKDGMLMARDTDYTMDYTNKKIIFASESAPGAGDGQIPQAESVIRINYKYMRV